MFDWTDSNGLQGCPVMVDELVGIYLAIQVQC